MSLSVRGVCRAFVLLILVLGLAACARPPKPTPLDVMLSADEGINPNASGEPSPVVVRVYELKAIRSFNSASYFELIDSDNEILGADLVSSREFEMLPGQSQDYKAKISNEAAYVGVVASFRDIQSAKWRDSMELRKGKRNRLYISLTRLSVSVDTRRRRVW